MEISDTVKYYNRIMCAETEGELMSLTLEIQCAILHKKLDNEQDMIILNLALQLKKQQFIISELMLTSSMAVIFSQDDFDPEAAQLEQFQKDEFEDFKDGKVLTMKDFIKRKK